MEQMTPAICVAIEQKIGLMVGGRVSRGAPVVLVVVEVVVVVVVVVFVVVAVVGTVVTYNEHRQLTRGTGEQMRLGLVPCKN